jgi:AcrR family transcriptional regulator
MRALPGRSSRTALADPAPDITRGTLAAAQRRRIRRATGELVAKRGYRAVSVELIIKRARVSFKTFYKHYANKEDAFADLFERAVTSTTAEVGESLERSDLPWPDQVAFALTTFFGAISAEPLIARACLVEGPTAGPRILGLYENAVRAFVPILRRGRRYNPEAASLPKTIEETLAGSVLWSAYQRLNFSEADRIAELLPETIELVLRPYIGDAEAARVAAEAHANLPAA